MEWMWTTLDVKLITTLRERGHLGVVCFRALHTQALLASGLLASPTHAVGSVLLHGACLGEAQFVCEVAGYTAAQKLSSRRSCLVGLWEGQLGLVGGVCLMWGRLQASQQSR